MKTKEQKQAFYVNLRYGFTLCVPVDAESEDEAIRLAKEQVEGGCSLLDGITDDDVEFIGSEVESDGD